MTANVVPAAILLAVALTGLLLLRSFSRWVRVTVDIVCFAALSAFLFSRNALPIFAPLKVTSDGSALWLRAVIGIWWLYGARIAAAMLHFVLRRDEQSRETRLFSDLAAGALYIVAVLVILNSVFFLPVTGLLATSGVLAIVLGLALQNTLADVFSGIAVGTESPFRVGDWIQIGDKIEGYVVQTNWRSIRIKTDYDDVATIPNSAVAKAEIINRSVPSRKRRISIELHCPNWVEPERVIEILLQATLLCPNVLQSPAPSTALVRLGYRQNLYTTAFFVDDFEHVTAAKSAFLRQAWRQLHCAGLLSEPESGEALQTLAHRRPLGGREILRELLLFESLTDQQIDKLATQLRRGVLEPGESLFAQGSSDATLYIVGGGILELSHSEASGPQRLGCIGAGDYVGEIGLLTGTPHAATATARTHCTIYQLSKTAIAPLLSENPKLMSAFDRAARRGLEILHREVAARASQGTEGKDQLLSRIRAFFRLSAATPGGEKGQ